MKFNTPLPQPLPKECDKAAKIFRSFVDRSNNGLDGVIPREVLENAKGFAIFTIVKAGFVFSARAGSGIVIARLPNGSESVLTCGMLRITHPSGEQHGPPPVLLEQRV
ncbi:hypothetical protein PM082_003137 [Marasmius tenuissimus]|nr:hypothetical protein PM082_003137 [Marasmius tenuissimus]